MLIKIGSIFSLLVFIHFVVDWVFQSHNEAMNKSKNWKARAKHCLVYMCGFVPFLHLTHLPWIYFFISINILFWSHFIEDTYYPVFLWVKYVRKPPQFNFKYAKSSEDKERFLSFVQTNLGLILMIAIDQIIHISFLIPIAWLIALSQ